MTEAPIFDSLVHRRGLIRMARPLGSLEPAHYITRDEAQVALAGARVELSCDADLAATNPEFRAGVTVATGPGGSAAVMDLGDIR